MPVLACDLGGTKALLGLYDFVDSELNLLRSDRYNIREFTGLEDLVLSFLGADRPNVFCLGAPGPRNANRMKMVNLNWVIDRHELSENLGIEKVVLLNDIEATCYGIVGPSQIQLATLNAVESDADGTLSVIAAGTGLGAGFLTKQNGRFNPRTSEGGHADFAPRNEEEMDLCHYLLALHGGRVCVEHVVSGQGLTNIYSFLRDIRGMDEPLWLTEEITDADDPNPVISRVASEGNCALCERALDMFVAAYGAAAGNLALTTCATGGIYLAGGIAPAIVERLRDGTFMRSFADKGGLRDFVLSMPVHVVLDRSVALKGAAGYIQSHM